MANSDILRIGVIGAGANTKLRHLPGFLEIEGVEVKTVCNRSEASSRKVAREFGIPNTASNWREVIADPEIDAIMIGTWPNLHASATIAGLKAGKHVLTEARMALNLEEAKAMLAASLDSPHLVAQIVPSPFSLGFDKTIRRMIEAGDLGDLYEIFVEFSNGIFADPQGPYTWRQDFEKSGVNTLFSGIMHEAVLRWVQSDPEWVVADGFIGTRARKDPETGENATVLIPEALSILARYPQGFKATYQFSGLASSVTRSEARLSGTKGALYLDLGKQELYVSVGDSEAYDRVEIPAEDRGSWRVEADFIDSIREGKPVTLTDFESGVRYMRFSQAVWDSWTDGSRKVWL